MDIQYIIIIAIGILVILKLLFSFRKFFLKKKDKNNDNSACGSCCACGDKSKTPTKTIK